MYLLCNIIAACFLAVATIAAWRTRPSWHWRALALAITLIFARRSCALAIELGLLRSDWRAVEGGVLLLISACLGVAMVRIAREVRK